jgi:hypothetical protein
MFLIFFKPFVQVISPFLVKLNPRFYIRIEFIQLKEGSMVLNDTVDFPADIVSHRQWFIKIIDLGKMNLLLFFAPHYGNKLLEIYIFLLKFILICLF